MGLVKRKAIQPAEAAKPKQEQSCMELAACLEDADPRTRRHAARDMLHCPHAAGVLASRLKREPETAVREVILTTLVRLNDPIGSRQNGRLPAQRRCGPAQRSH